MKSRYVFIAITIFFMVMLIIFPERYITSVASGLNLYALNVLPALFPFLFFSKVLAQMHLGYDLGKAMNKPIKKIYNASGMGGYVLVMAMLSGYPVGAKVLSDLYTGGHISTKDARTISTFTSSSGPLFIVGTVGIIMLDNKLVGFIILISHYLGTLLNGLLYRPKKSSTDTDIMLLPPTLDTSKVLGESMTDSIISVAVVGGYIAIFSMALEVMSNLNIIALFARICNLAGVNYNLGVGFFSSLVEVTSGCLMLSKSGSLKTIIPLCTFAITFGGLSITLQSMTFLAKCKIKPAFYLFSKLTQALIATIISIPLSLFF